MKQPYLRDQRGVAMVFELVLVAVVVSLIGLAVYQSNKYSSNKETVETKVAAGAGNIAEAAVAIGESDAASESAVSAGAEASVNDVAEADVDISNLGDSASENAY